MLKAIIFDLNGIFINSTKLSDRFAKDFGISHDVFLPKLGEIMDETRKQGAQPAFTYWKPVLDSWNVKFTEEDFWNYWFGEEKVSTEMIELAKILKKDGLKIFILSNNFKERAEFYGHYEWIHDAIHKVYFSWQTGLIKPDPKAWLAVLTENNLKAEECLYFDDQEKNVKAAESIGIKSHVFKDVIDTQKVIEEVQKHNK